MRRTTKCTLAVWSMLALYYAQDNQHRPTIVIATEAALRPLA